MGRDGLLSRVIDEESRRKRCRKEATTTEGEKSDFLSVCGKPVKSGGFMSDVT